jgi:histidinol phosphatase-like enzyme
MTYVFDIDGTLCTLSDGFYENAKPIESRIAVVNKLHEEGHKIILLTARGMGRSGNSSAYAHEVFYDLTHKQLKDWGVKFDDLFLGKPAGDLYVDDKGMRDVDFFTTMEATFE